MNINSVIDIKPNKNIGEFAPGDTVKVSIKVVEGDRERTQTLEGTVLRMRHGGAGASLTIRRVSWGVGVEHIFPVHSPRLEKVELVRKGKVRRAKLYYLRGVKGKLARIKEGAALKELLETGIVPEEAPATAAPEAAAPAPAPAAEQAAPTQPAAEAPKAPEASTPASDEAKK